MDRSRRQAVIDIVTALGVIFAGTSLLGRRARAGSAAWRGSRPRRGTAGAGPAPRVRPAPFAVKRHG